MFSKKDTIKATFEKKVVLYGRKAAVVIAIKAALRRLLRIDWQKCYLMSCSLDSIPSLPERKDIEVRELSLADYDNELWKEFLTEQKHAIYEARFKNSHAHAYGAFVDGVLAYSTWILYGEVIFSNTKTLFKSPDCALLLDTYCHPSFRGKGIHSYMNHWALCEIRACGTKKAYVIILSYNCPAIKTQVKCGMRVERMFYSFRVGKNNYTIFKGKNENG